MGDETNEPEAAQPVEGSSDSGQPEAAQSDGQAESPEAQPEQRSRARRAFGPVVLLGLASSGLAAWAGSKALVTGSSGDLSTENAALLSPAQLEGATTSPLVAALALVVLASWGVLLVTRGLVRRGIAGLAVVASIGLFISTWVAGRQLTDKVQEYLLSVSGAETASSDLTGWFTAALVASALSVLAGALALLWVGQWPEMGSRYDAPSSGGPSDDDLHTNLDIWKALDEGRDPTA